MAAKPLFNQVTIVGLGLIGGSLGMALKRRRLARRVVGLARRPATLRLARAVGAIDRGTTRIAAALEQADLVVLATPPGAVVSLARAVVRRADRRLILTDVASTKAQLVRSIEAEVRRRGSSVAFVGGHPMAGSERSGIGAARPTLFEGAACVLTPTSGTAAAALSKVRSLWRALGARVVEVSPQRHDQLVAQVSQVPHMAAVGLVNAASPEALRLCGTGFSSTTRIAQANPQLWVEISRTNAGWMVRSMDRLLRTLAALRQDVAQGREKRLLKKLRAAQRRRQRLAK